MLTQIEFDQALKQWNQETCLHSFPWTILRGPGYEKIKSFGEEAIPFLIRTLQRNEKDEYAEHVPVWGIHWHLTALTKIDIFVGEEESLGKHGKLRKGLVNETSDAWIKWGKENGKLE